MGRIILEVIGLNLGVYLIGRRWRVDIGYGSFIDLESIIGIYYSSLGMLGSEYRLQCFFNTISSIHSIENCSIVVPINRDNDDLVFLLSKCHFHNSSILDSELSKRPFGVEVRDKWLHKLKPRFLIFRLTDYFHLILFIKLIQTMNIYWKILLVIDTKCKYMNSSRIRRTS